MEKITGIIERVIHKNGNGFIIFSMLSEGRRVPVTGEDQDLFEADVVECEGDWTQYKGQPQFKAKTIIPQIPTTTQAIVAYLARIKGIGPVFASRLGEAFGKDIIYVIENEPDRLKKVSGFGAKRIKLLEETISVQIGYRSTLLFLHGFGLSKNLIKKISDKYGLLAVDKIKADPYQLCEDIAGVGFNTADRIGQQMGIDPEHPCRLLAGVLHALSMETSGTGNTGIPEGQLISTAQAMLSRNGTVSEKAIIGGVKQAIKNHSAVRFSVSGDEYIFPEKLYRAEKGIAEHVARLLGVRSVVDADQEAMDELIDEVQADFGLVLGENQRSAVKMSLMNPVVIITGGPGTGKTTIMRVFLECCRRILGLNDLDITACAPTGKAAKRLSQASGLEAKTIHRALEYNPIEEGFNYNAECSLPASVVVVDESSMTDTELCHWLIQAVATGARLIILGDVDQLPSVGPGKVLSDMIQSGVIPVTRLTEIRRQAANSKIIVNAHRINNGEAPLIDNSDKTTDFWFLREESDEVIADTLVGLVGRLSKHYGHDPFEDIQILTLQRKGILGVYELNTRLQKLLNGKNLGTGIKIKQDDWDVELCLSDKVMHIKNNKNLGVFNGEIGRITSVDRKARIIKVTYEDKVVEYAYADLEELRLSYAKTIHKSQGSEYPVVIIPCTTSHMNMLNRAIFYTGITRARAMTVMVGMIRAINIAASRTSNEKRLTGLLQHLQNEIQPMAA
jgi:exodeoxyribonuclease V alpha subunit